LEATRLRVRLNRLPAVHWWVSTWIDDRLWASKTTSVCNQPPRSTQPSIPPGYQVPASGWGYGGASSLVSGGR